MSNLKDFKFPAQVLLDQIKTVDGTGTGLDADLLDGNEGSFYRDAGNLDAGTVPEARLPAASASAKGIVELATDAETTTGTDTTRAVTPAGLASFVVNATFGSWTPVLVDTSFSPSEGQTYGTNNKGSYTRIGNTVFIQGCLAVASIGSLTTSSSAFMRGLPFRVENDANDLNPGCAVHRHVNVVRSTSEPIFLFNAFGQPYDDYLKFAFPGVNQMTSLTINAFTGSDTIMYFSGQYTTDG